MGKRYNFFKKVIDQDIHKNCCKPLIIKGKHIEIMMWYYLIPAKMTLIKGKIFKTVGQNVKKMESVRLLGLL
jgi:hypothetical protein